MNLLHSATILHIAILECDTICQTIAIRPQALYAQRLRFSRTALFTWNSIGVRLNASKEHELFRRDADSKFNSSLRCTVFRILDFILPDRFSAAR